MPDIHYVYSAGTHQTHQTYDYIHPTYVASSNNIWSVGVNTNNISVNTADLAWTATPSTSNGDTWFVRSNGDAWFVDYEPTPSVDPLEKKMKERIF